MTKEERQEELAIAWRIQRWVLAREAGNRSALRDWVPTRSLPKETGATGRKCTTCGEQKRFCRCAPIR